MDLSWLARNIVDSWRFRAGPLDAMRRLFWVYSHKLPAWIGMREYTIGFRYPDPVAGIKLLLRANSGSDCFIHGEVFEHEYYRLGLDAPPETILDLGANAGLTAVYFGRVYPNARIACVEPVFDNLRVLERNLELNAIRAEVISGAADVTDGRALMELGPMDYGHKIRDVPPDSYRPSLEVETFSIYTIVKRLGWERIGLLKMDIEGHEKVLFSTGCDWLNLVDAMCIECHEGFGEADLKAIASKYGFEQPEPLPGIWLLRRTPA